MYQIKKFQYFLTIGILVFSVSISQADTTNITIDGISPPYFSPASTVIHTGDAIKWTNGAAVTHTSTADGGLWDAGHLAPGVSFTFTFNTSGTFPYHCTIHTFMHATVYVVFIQDSTPPTANFTVDDNNGFGNLTVTFKDNSSHSFGNAPSWFWNFGDGNTGTGATTQHIYTTVSTPTTYTVFEIVTTLFGTSTSSNQIITVTEPAPNAFFTASPLNGYGPLTVLFTDSSNNFFGNNTSWNWNFGDGSTSNEQNPFHVYDTVTASTTYTVQLIVTTDFGTNTSTHSNYIQVNTIPAVKDWNRYSASPSESQKPALLPRKWFVFNRQ